MRGSLFLIFFLSIILTSCSSQKKGQHITSNFSGSLIVDGSRLDYVVKGKGKDCLVIGSSIYYPKTFSHELYPHLRMHFVDLKWFAKGYEKEDLDSVDIAAIVEDVEAIRKQLGLEKPLLIGHSIHGTIAMEYAKQYADQISALLVIGSPAAWGNETYDKKAAELWKTASEERKSLQEENWGKASEIDRLTGEEEASARYDNMSPQYWYNPRYDATWLWDDMTVHSELTQHLFTTVFAAYDMFEDQPKISIPVLVILGKYDYVIPHTLWRSAYENMPNFTLKLFEKSGHTPQLEQAALFNKTLLEWLKINAIE